MATRNSHSDKTARNEKPVRGATATTISWREVFDAWFSHHRESARDSFHRQCRAPLQHLLTALVIGITLALPTLFAMAIDNLQQLGQRWDGAPRLSVFIRRDAPADRIAQLQALLQQDASVKSVTLITPEQGLADFEKNSGVSGTLDLLDENPLPPVLAVALANDMSADAVHALQISWQQQPDVERVQADIEWVRKLFHFMQLGKRITIVLAALLGLGALLATGNTIRLAIENRRTEIVVAKLVGATDAFVRRPFLYSGFWSGLSGGLVAVLLVLAGHYSVVGPVTELVALYGSDFALRGMDALTALGLLFIGIVLGMLGAWLAVGQHLHEMRPR